MIETAGVRDVPDLIALMAELAKYEKLPAPGNAEAKRLAAAMRGADPRLHALLARDRGRAVGYALYFYTFSTFLARPTLYLEDLFVLPDTRGQGFGRALFRRCVREGKKKGCGRMEWAVLDWNEPAHRFYRGSGARLLKEWQLYRLTLRPDAF